MDNKFKFNNYGQNAKYDFSPKKAKDNIYRIIVFGDSFTNDLALSTAWPETLHHLLNSRKEFNNTFEVYSFTTDGGGLIQWYTTFKETVDKEFEYDAILLADWGNDHFRDWIVVDSTETKYRVLFTKYEDRPQTKEQFEALILKAEASADIKGEKWLDEYADSLKKNAKPKDLTPSFYYSGDRSSTAELPPGNYMFSKETFTKRYGEMRYSMLSEIVSICKAKNKDVIYSVIPSLDGLISIEKEGLKLMSQVQGEGLCKHFDIHFFDGFEAFKGIDSQSLVDFYWLKYDFHWNLGAATHYALKLADWIFKNKIFSV